MGAFSACGCESGESGVVGGGGGVMTFPHPGEQVGMRTIYCPPFLFWTFFLYHKQYLFSLFQLMYINISA